MEKKIDAIEVDGMGLVCGGFLREMWDSDNRPLIVSDFKATLTGFRDEGASKFHFFAYAYDGTGSNQYQSKVCPFRRVTKGENKGKYNLSQKNEKYFKLLKTAVRLIFEAGLEPVPCFFMNRYNELQFRNNVNGVSEFWDERAERFQIQMINWVQETIVAAAKAAGKERKFYYGRLINEPAHNGNSVRFHRIHDWLRNMYEGSMLKQWVPLKRLYVDTGECEAHPFMKEHPSPKDPNFIIGDNRYLTPNGKAQIRIINHGYSIPENIGPEFYLWAKSPSWPKPSMWYAGGDGGSGNADLAKGHKLKDPNGRVLWSQGDEEQTYRMCREIFREAENKNKLAGYQITFFETLVGWPLREDFRMAELGRLRAVVRAYKEIHP